MNDFALALIVMTNLILVGIILLIFHRRSQARFEAQAALGQRILERFESAEKAAEFLSTDAGRRLLASAGAVASPAQKVLGSVSAGLILVAIGIGMLVASELVNSDPIILPGAVILSAGLGCLVAAWVSHRLSVRWGLIGTPDSPRHRDDGA